MNLDEEKTAVIRHLLQELGEYESLLEQAHQQLAFAQERVSQLAGHVTGLKLSIRRLNFKPKAKDATTGN